MSGRIGTGNKLSHSQDPHALDFSPAIAVYSHLKRRGTKMANAELLKDACEFVARIKLKKVAVLNYLGENTSAYNRDRVERAMKPRGDQGQEPSRARVVMGESQKIALTQGSIYASIETVRHVGRLARDKKAGECDQFACATVEELLTSEECKEQAPRIEILGNGGHAFVVVNRRESAALNDIDAWDRAIFVDAWSFNQGLSKEPVYWANESPSLRGWAGANLIKSLFVFDETDWLLVD
jgi:hypothetical protein